MNPALLKIDWSKVWTWSEFWAWSEVWALLIPLTILLIRRKKITAELKPVVYYILIALFLNFIADFTWRFQLRIPLPEWMWNNSSIYHIHSITRLLLFSWFFILLKEPFLTKLKKTIPILFLFFVIADFIILRPLNSFITEFNSELLATEAGLLLLYCLQHYLYLSLHEQTSSHKNHSINWIIAGLTIYVAINFFNFLFYSALMKTSHIFSQKIWDVVHNNSYIFLCFFIAKGLYESDKSKS